MSLIFRMVFLAQGGQRGRATNHSAVAGGDRNRFEEDQILGMATTERPKDYSSLRELGYFF